MESEGLNAEEDIYKVAKKYIRRFFLLFINPKKALEYIKIAIENLANTEEFINYFNSDEAGLNLIIHIAIMIERVIMGNRVKFEKVEEYKRRSYKEFFYYKRGLKNYRRNL